MSITDFLNARICEDEAVARAAVENVAPDEWESELGSLNLWPQDIAHWNRHDPARVLAECAAKRAIIDLADEAGGMDSTLADEDYGFHDIEDKILRTLAAVYAGHQDYQSTWRES